MFCFFLLVLTCSTFLKQGTCVFLVAFDACFLIQRFSTILSVSFCFCSTPYVSQQTNTLGIPTKQLIRLFLRVAVVLVLLACAQHFFLSASCFLSLGTVYKTSNLLPFSVQRVALLVFATVGLPLTSFPSKLPRSSRCSGSFPFQFVAVIQSTNGSSTFQFVAFQ